MDRVRLGLTLNVLVLLLLLNMGRAAAQPPAPQATGSGFTFQGQLKRSGGIFTGPCDFQFQLFNAAKGGNQVTAIVETKGITLTNGLFTVQLDFGAGVFMGAPRWLQIGVRCQGEANYTPFDERQELTGTPMALFSNTSNVSNSTSGLQGRGVSSAAPSFSQVLKWNGGQWAPSTDLPLLAGSGGSSFAAKSDHNHFGVAWVGVNNYYGLLVENNGSGRGIESHSNTNLGVFASSVSYRGIEGSSQNGDGVLGFSYNANGIGVYGRNDLGLAGAFTGNVAISGSLSKGAGSFKIDHPLDPANKYLSHSFVESPDMMNIYNDNITLGPDGAAVVQLPAYFEALNMEFRYQLTAIGAPGPNLYIAEEIKNNSFKIAGGTAGMKVSWQVTGIRHDPYANAHRIVVEENKPPQERGKYLYPRELGQPKMLGVDQLRQSSVPNAQQAEAAEPAR